MKLLPNKHTLLLLLLLSPGIALAVYPQGTHTNIYFPHLVDGGPPAQQWQTTFIFMNPGQQSARVTLFLYDDNGQPLALDLGLGLRSQVTFVVPQSGTRVLRSRMASPFVVGGSAYAFADSPVQATCLFRAIEGGVHRVEVAAPPASPGVAYSSFATAQLGVALANVYTNIPITLRITAHDSEGRPVGMTTVTLPPSGHTAFNLENRLAGLPTGYFGVIYIKPIEPTQYFIAWTLNVDRGLIATLPSGAQVWPVSHWDESWMAFQRTWQALKSVANSSPEMAFLKTVSCPRFSLVSEYQGQKLNAFAGADEIVLTYGLAELISDSPSELGWIIAHEMGHVIQRQTGVWLLGPANSEFDADLWGFMLSLGAGYDPYAAAGALSKLAMITGTAGLVQQFEQQLAADAHKSFNTRLDVIFLTMEVVCDLAPGACQNYRDLIHPHFPSQAPLSVPKAPEMQPVQQHPGGSTWSR